MIYRPILFGSESKGNLKSNAQVNRLFDIKNTALIIIDVQEKLISAISNSDELKMNILKISEACDFLNVAKYITEQNPEKLGNSVKEILKGNELINISKMSFSCAECEDLIKELKSRKIKNILLVGLETHICILQSAFDLYRIGFNVQVIADSVMSRKRVDHEIAIKRFSQSGIQVTTTETAIFELCKTALHPNFRELSRIVKGTKN